MNVVVFAKPIPNIETIPRLDPETHRLVREHPLVLDDSDRYGVETALQLVEQDGGGEVVLVAMAPDGETAGLRAGLAMGAARAVLVSDPALAGSDALATAKVLAAVVRRVGPDLVLAATESSDGYTGTVPVQVAELLSWPAVSFAKHVEVSEGHLAVHRQTERGVDEVACPLPAVVSVTAGVVEPRYPALKNLMRAKSSPVEVLSVADLELDPMALGAAGARQVVVSVESAPSRTAGRVVVDEGAAHELIVALLDELKFL